MELTKDNLIIFFKNKLNEADNINPVENPDDLDRWWSMVKYCGEKMNGKYLEILEDGVRFTANSYIIDNPTFNRAADDEARANGLNKAKNNIKKIIENLESFGYTSESDATINDREINKADKRIENNIINNYNAQNSNIVIDVRNFDIETRTIISKLQKEFAKKKKNKETIKKLLDKLVDNGLEVLQKIFLHFIGI